MNITCPRCGGVSGADPRRLISHLVTVHLVSPTTATQEAHAALTGASLPNGTPHKTLSVPTTPGPKESPMPDQLCNYCKRKDGTHSEKCRKKDGCMRCARRKPDDPCPYHGGVRLKPKAQRERSPKASPRKGRAIGGLDTKAASMLTAAKARVGELRAELTAQEAKVAILSELVGA